MNPTFAQPMADDDVVHVSAYLGFARDQMIVARHSDVRAVWVDGAIANLRKAIEPLGFKLIRRVDRK